MSRPGEQPAPRGVFVNTPETTRLNIPTLLLTALLGVLPPAITCAAEAEPGQPPAGATLTLLGTAGGPGGKPQRAGIASLLTVDGTNYLIDAGEAVARQLARAGLSESEISTVFLTHLHDDHTAGLPALASFAHTLRTRGMTLYGPPGTERLLEGLLAFQAVDAEIRIAESPGRLADPRSLFKAQDVTPGTIYSDERLTVTAVENTHYHLGPDSPAARNTSLSYRFEMPGRTVVFTGDTGPCEAVERLARGADILVSEMVSASDIAGVPPFVREHMLQEHLTATEVGRLASAAGVKLLVLSHIGTVAEDDVAEVRRHYGGRLVVGEDLARF